MLASKALLAVAFAHDIAFGSRAEPMSKTLRGALPSGAAGR